MCWSCLSINRHVPPARPRRLQGHPHVAVAAVHGYRGVLDALCAAGGQVSLKALHHATDMRSMQVRTGLAADAGAMRASSPQGTLALRYTTRCCLCVAGFLGGLSWLSHRVSPPPLQLPTASKQGLRLLLARGRPPVLSDDTPVHIGGAHGRSGELCVMLRLLRDTAFRVRCCACCDLRSVRYAALAARHMRLLSRLAVPCALPRQLELYSLPSCGASMPVACPAWPAALLSLPVPAPHPCLPSCATATGLTRRAMRPRAWRWLSAWQRPGIAQPCTRRQVPCGMHTCWLSAAPEGTQEPLGKLGVPLCSRVACTALHPSSCARRASADSLCCPPPP